VKAAIVEQAGRTPVYGDFKEPVPSTEENRIAVTAAALSPVVKARAPATHYSSSGGFPVKFEARIKEFIENFPDLVALVERFSLSAGCCASRPAFCTGAWWPPCGVSWLALSA
jgi:hypothetical protein